jgi:energy-coupling factor transporter ATP-binding protein EcfA2
MKIVKLQAENVKKLVAVEIAPTGNLVQITGKNGAGKTSVLDAIWWALAGASHIQAVPIRKGAKEARIRLDLGELKVTRTFRAKEDGGATTAIYVENADGARFPSPQSMLDELLGQLTFDPLAFSRMKPREQFDALRKFVPGVDFEAIENAHRGDFQRRTELNGLAKRARAAASLIVYPDTTPDVPVDVSALAGELEEAGKHNAEIENRKARRDEAVRQIEANRALAATRHEEAMRMRQQADQIDQEASRHSDAALQLQARLDHAEPLPDPIDTVILRGKIDGAKTVNDLVAQKKRRAELEQEALGHEAAAEQLSNRMAERQAQKEASIAAAAIPVQGISFGEGQVLLDGQPFEQASDAQQLQASVAIAMAENPKLRVIRIRDGSLLDSSAMELLAKLADERDMQVWIERVDDSGKIGFVIEDGHNKATEAEAVHNPTAA